jgi:hypothetical protein
MGGAIDADLLARGALQLGAEGPHIGLRLEQLDQDQLVLFRLPQRGGGGAIGGAMHHHAGAAHAGGALGTAIGIGVHQQHGGRLPLLVHAGIG